MGYKTWDAIIGIGLLNGVRYGYNANVNNLIEENIMMDDDTNNIEYT